MQKVEDFHLDRGEQAKEQVYFKSILRAFDGYLPFSLSQNNARRKSYYSLPRAHQQLLTHLGSPLPLPQLDGGGGEEEAGNRADGVPGRPEAFQGLRGVKARLEEIDDRIRRNADVLHLIVQDARDFMGDEDGDASGAHLHLRTHPNTHANGPPPKSVSGGTRRKRKRIPAQDLDKVRSTLKQFVRDWSECGRAERDAAYQPILDALERYLPQLYARLPQAGRPLEDTQQRQVHADLRVLVPGAGLGRLAFEIAKRGFSCQGNEFSFFMLVASHFILNNTSRVNEHTLYPYIHSASNWRTARDMLAPIYIPDVLPNTLPSQVDFSMVAGEFVEVYSKSEERGAWDAVATCYFIDTARNIMRYLETLNHILPLGGLWVNVGPLLWHYENGGDLSIELTLEEVLGLLPKMGFEVVERRSLPPQMYTGNAAGMLTYEYHPEFWIARKVMNVEPSGSV
ncbi:N2227-domain-containing protein [Tilletiaria anomala UBC 951]|uniref:carnosine N-methyltransferase n=1 Tax=Tilletiaria anomala (strain ATCC 24038 / CBS 436.72 / UBC 951) TaxID=1037660 RepID=A0A066V870_TILAU|nr:N2227-domain-containing protein [Tilletiaria anomala UBC 951]KDN36483.1 N2227-domain-containing protein [Tilletiaria anomala UBC 951]